MTALPETVTVMGVKCSLDAQGRYDGAHPGRICVEVFPLESEVGPTHKVEASIELYFEGATLAVTLEAPLEEVDEAVKVRLQGVLAGLRAAASLGSAP